MIITFVKQRLRFLTLIINLIDRVATFKILKTVFIKKKQLKRVNKFKQAFETSKQVFEKQTNC